VRDGALSQLFKFVDCNREDHPVTLSFDSVDSHVSIHILPAEIIVEIVHLCIQSPRPLQDLIRLALVCRRWRMITEGTAFLWGTIDAAAPSGLVRKALRMVKDAPLDLTFNEATAKMNQEDFFKSIGEKVTLWRSLVVHLESRSGDFALSDLETTTPPNLEILHLVLEYRAWDSRDTMDLFGGNSISSRLKELSLACIPIRLASLRFGGLKFLTLVAIPAISSSDIITVLVESPLLETVQLQELDPLIVPIVLSRGLASMVHPDDEAIQLASLSHLSLKYLDVPFLNFLFSTIAVPQLRSLCIICEEQDIPIEQLLSVGMRHLTPILPRITSDTPTFTITISYFGYYQIRIGGLDLTFYLDNPVMDHFQDTLNWISNHLGRALQDIPLYLHLDSLLPDPTYLQLLTDRTTVTKLTLRCDPYYGPDGAKNIIPFLSRPMPSPSTEWLVPHAEILDTNIVNEHGNPDIVDMIEKRNSADVGLDGGGTVTPRPFREIWLAYGGKWNPDRRRPNIAFLREVQGVARGAVVYWEQGKWTGSGDNGLEDGN
ncbi:hypothetical protein FRC05_002280, partial [Tulasnella sp. 425]